MAGILIMAEHLQGRLHDISREMIGAAVKLKDSLGGPITVVVAAPDPQAFVEGLNLAGVDRIAVMAALQLAHELLGSQSENGMRQTAEFTKRLKKLSEDVDAELKRQESLF